MSQTTVPRTASTTPHRAVFAGVLLMVSGVMNVFQGITAITKDDLYVHIGNYAYKFSLTSWGWIHLILGVAVVIVGWGAYSGARWARVIGVAVVCLAMLGNFLWLPYQPWWALTLLAIDGFALWSLIGHGDEPAGY